ncbi:MAG: ATP-binding protein [Candidatus Limnocylindrales bacterium]
MTATERRPAAPPRPEPATNRTLAAAALVLEITTAAAGERDLDAILRSTLGRLSGVVSFTGGSIALLDGEDLVIRAAVGPFEAEALGQRLARGPSRSWQVIVERAAVRIDDLLAGGPHAAGPRAATEMRSWLAVPIERRGVAVGLLEVDSVEPNAFFAEDERLLTTVGQALAGPIDLAARYADEARAREVRDAFIGIVSHELRTPITTIYGMSRVLRQRAASMDPDAYDQALDDIEAEAERLRRLTEDLLVLSRAEGGRLHVAADPILVGHIVVRSIEGESARWPGHQFTTDVPPGLPLVAGEDLYVEQVVRNLLSNAAKYSPAGSTIHTAAAAEADGVAVRVLDEGPGLRDQVPDQLFDLFYRAPEAIRQTSGAGIGLFVCRELITAMGGRLWATDRRDATGAEFGFWLPVLADDAFDPD